jgi:hypothetical protein
MLPSGLWNLHAMQLIDPGMYLIRN